MVTFKSIIVFDAETTSLPKVDHNTTKITELAFIGCEVKHLNNSNELPRVLHKLVLLFNPNKPIHPEASKVSGLSNELLENVQPFRKNDVDILREFINRLPSPICIVAHNGDNFDFPILRRALVKVNKELQNNVYCVDSLKAFRSLLSTNNSSCENSLWTRRPRKISNETTPEHQKSQPFNHLQHKHVSRNLFPNTEALSDWGMIQSHFPDAHRAEEDSKALLSCIVRCEGFLKWINENAVIFNSVPPLF